MSKSAAQPAGTTDEWLSLQEASARLGVTASTMRRWADAGRIATKRTLGGHRRFARAAVEQLAHALPGDPAPEPPPPLAHTDERELAQHEWHAQLAARPASGRMRELGQRLLGVLIQYINRRDEEARFLEEARQVGIAYGAEARAAGISIYDTIEAFLLFRNLHGQYVAPLPGMAQPTNFVNWMTLHIRINQFMDTILLGVVAGFEGEQ